MRLSDLQVYIKFLSKNKLYTFVSVFGFSISLMFIIILGVYVKQQLSVDDFQEKKDRIFLMTHDYGSGFGNPVADYVKDKCPEVEAYVRILSRSVAIGEKGTEKVRVEGLFADSTFFNVFTYKLLEGSPSQVLSAHKSVVVTQSFARRIFGDKNPVGASLSIDNSEHTITGIMEDMPYNSIFPQCEFVVNYYSITNYWDDQILTSSDNFGFTIFFLEKQGADLQAKVPMLLNLFKDEFWSYKHGFSDKLEFVSLKDVYFDVQSVNYWTIREGSKNQVMVYIGIAILILVISLLNYVNLTVAQAGFRGKEAAMKKLMGCSRRGLIMQLLVESLVMTLLAFIIGLLLAFFAEPFFDNMLGTKLALAQQFSISVISLCALFILLIAFVSGLIPALVISSFNPLEVVKGTFARKVKSSYSKGLIIFQYTVAIALLICSFFMQRQSDFLINHDMGYNREGILEMWNVFNSTQLDGFRSKLLSIPGVEVVSYTCGTPSNGGNNYSSSIDGQQYSWQELVVDSSFFSIYGIKINPTGITATDKTYWVNQAGYNAVNPDPSTFTAQIDGKSVQIAGIVSDFSLRSLDQPTGIVRLRMMRKTDTPWNIVVKINSSDLYTTAKSVEKEFTDYSGGELPDAQFVDDIIQEWYDKEQKATGIMSAFTILTIVIMVMGVFAMSLYMIRQKEKEIGIRKVNGATEGEILLMLNKDTLMRVFIAFIIATPIAYFAMNKWLEGFLYKINIVWWVFVSAGIIVVLLTIISVSYQTWRAARANPVESLKSE